MDSFNPEIIDSEGKVTFILGVLQSPGCAKHITGNDEIVALIRSGDHVGACVMALNEVGEKHDDAFNPLRHTSISIEGMQNTQPLGLQDLIAWVRINDPKAVTDLKKSRLSGLAANSDIARQIGEPPRTMRPRVLRTAVRVVDTSEIEVDDGFPPVKAVTPRFLPEDLTDFVDEGWGVPSPEQGA